MPCTIAFTGDIMCHMPQLNACSVGDVYDFSAIFSKATRLFKGCDFVVGNLETPVAGQDAGYSAIQYQFNTPFEFVQEVKKAGFDLVSTANNHTLDRGYEGVVKTLNHLDALGLLHTGSARSKEERNTPCICTINNVKIGFVSYTYGINAFFHNDAYTEENRFCCNLFMPQEGSCGAIDLQSYDTIAQYVDAYYFNPSPIYDSVISPYLKQMTDDVKRCREAGADFIVFLMHSGGQYNPEPEEYTKHLTHLIRQTGVDLIIGNHPHRMHKMVTEEGIPTAYSLGNFSFTPQPTYRRDKYVCEDASYSAVVKATFGNHSVSNIKFAICKNVIQSDGKSLVIPIVDLISGLPVGDELNHEKVIFKHLVNKFLDRNENTPVEIREWYDYSE